MGLFGPSRKEMWEKLCEEIGADYIDGGFWKSDRVQAKVGNWTMILDTYTVSTGKTSTTYTRMRAPYVNPNGFRFKIYDTGFFSMIGKSLGMQDITIGEPEFDELYIIQGNEEEKVRSLFSNGKIRELVRMQPAIHLEVKPEEGFFGTDFPEGVEELYFQVHGVIKDIEMLKALFELFTDILNDLCELGLASDKNPDIELR